MAFGVVGAFLPAAETDAGVVSVSISQEFSSYANGGEEILLHSPVAIGLSLSAKAPIRLDFVLPLDVLLRVSRYRTGNFSCALGDPHVGGTLSLSRSANRFSLSAAYSTPVLRRINPDTDPYTRPEPEISMIHVSTAYGRVLDPVLVFVAVRGTVALPIRFVSAALLFSVTEAVNSTIAVSAGVDFELEADFPLPSLRRELFARLVYTGARSRFSFTALSPLEGTSFSIRLEASHEIGG